MPITIKQLARPALLAGLGLGAATALQATEWNVVTETSSVEFTAMQQGTEFTGMFEEFTADIRLDPSNPTEGHIEGTVVTDSVNTRDYDRDSSLVDSNWFDSSQYPEATFVADEIKPLDDGSYEAVGELTLKGTTNEETMTFTLEPGAGNSAKFNGTMNLNRFDYGVGEGWNDTTWVGEDVAVNVSLDLKTES